MRVSAVSVNQRLVSGIVTFVMVLALAVPLPVAASSELGSQESVSVSGTVTDSVSGLPVVGASVSTEYEDAGGDPVYVSVVTDANGDYGLSVPTGTYQIVVEADRYVRAADEVTYDGANPVLQDFVLVPQVRALYGTVTDAGTGTPLANASVQLSQGSLTFLVFSDALGDYEVYVDPGVRTYDVSVLAVGYNEIRETLPFDGSTAVQRDYALVEMATISGHVTDSASGEPIANALMTVTSASLVTPIQQSTDSEGFYSVQLPAGTFDVRAAQFGYEPLTYTVPFDGVTPVVQDFALTPIPPAIAGHVTDADTGAALSGVTVLLSYYDDESETWQVIHTVTTGADGAYGLIDADGPGDDDERRLEAFHESYLDHVYTFAVTGTTITYDIALELPPLIPVEGANRYETAVAASRLAYPEGLDPDGAKTVVIATGGNWPDALGGTSLAGVLDGPVLLVRTTYVPAVVMEEIARLGVDKAIILGGTGAVGGEVEVALKAEFGPDNVERIAGTSRYVTANLIAERVIEEVEAAGGYDGVAFVATGANFPDALAAAPLAAANGWPLFLSAPTSGLSDSTKAAMSDVTDVLVLGGTGVVSTDVEEYLVGRYGELNVERLAGGSRYQTAAVVAAYGVESAGLRWNRAGISTGENFPDALAGGVLQGTARSVMLLTTSTALRSETREALETNADAISTLTFFGGSGAVSDVVRQAALSAIE